MIPTRKQCEVLHRKYASSDKHFELCWRHSVIVAEIALWCADKKGLEVDRELLEASCLLHDIGAYMLMDENAKINQYYNLHALFGAKLLEEEGVDDRVCSAVETHVMLGLTAADFKNAGWLVPYNDYTPRTVEAQLVSYGDRFHSKVPIFNAYETVLSKMKKSFSIKVKVLEEQRNTFGLPDLQKMAKTYKHPIQ